MRSINDMLPGLVEDEWNEVTIDHGDYCSSKPVITKLELDPSMPEIYPLIPGPVFDVSEIAIRTPLALACGKKGDF